MTGSRQSAQRSSNSSQSYHSSIGRVALGLRFGTSADMDEIH